MLTRQKRTTGGQPYIGVLDIGTSKVCSIVAAAEPQARGQAPGYRILGIGHQRSRGIKAGVIVDLDEAEQAVRAAVSQSERMAGVQIDEVLLAVSCGRLMSRHFTANAAIEGGVGPDDVVDFAHLVLAEDLSVLVQKIEGLIGRGVDVDALYFDLFSPTAKLLGSMWEEDFCTFNDVTVGLCRLQQLVYEFSDRLQPEQTGAGRNALFALTPGDQHSFGLVVVVEFFRRAGWRTVCAAEASASDLVDMVRSESFDLIGFSMSDEKWLDPLPELIASLRAASRNPLVRVIVGGRVFTDRPERVAEVGADETAEDAREAVRSADQLVGKSAVA